VAAYAEAVRLSPDTASYRSGLLVARRRLRARAGGSAGNA
jgi:hypothetical protein